MYSAFNNGFADQAHLSFNARNRS